MAKAKTIKNMTEWKVEKVRVTPLGRDLEIKLNSITKNGGRINSVMITYQVPSEFVIVYKQPIVKPVESVSMASTVK